MPRLPGVPDLGDARPSRSWEMTETVEVDTVDGYARVNRNEVSRNHPVCVSSGHEQAPEVDEMINQNLWCPNMPLAVDEDGMVQYQP